MTADPHLLQEAALNIQAFLKDYAPPAPPPSNVIRVTAGQHLQGVIDAAAPGSVLELEPATWHETIHVGNRTLKAAVMPPPGRATATSATARIISDSVDGTVIVEGALANFFGLEMQSANPDAEIVVIQRGVLQTLLSQCTVLGDPVKGQRRGIRAEGTGMQVLQCHVGEIWRVGMETQAIGASDGCRDLLIDDSTLEGASQALMLGGSDSGSPDRMPANVTVRRSRLTKQLRWYALKAQIKCALELKACRGFFMLDTILEYAGVAEGQGAYLIVLTPRNQSGTAPWSSVENVNINQISGRFAGGCVSMLGQDDVNASGLCRQIGIRNAYFSDIDPHGVWKGDGRAIFLNSAPQDVTLEHWTILGANLGASLYGGPFDKPPVRFTMRDVHLPPALYGIKIDGGGMGLAAWQAWAPDAMLDGSAGPGAVGYPAP